MKIDKITRELGKAIQESKEYERYQKAKEEHEADDNLNAKIGEFNLKKLELERLASQKDRDQEKISELNGELKGLYDEIFKIPSMAEFNAAGNEINTIVNRINQIIKLCLNGEDPETCEPHSCSGCSGGCSSGSCG